MILEIIENNIKYILSNENLKTDDKVFPISRGICKKNKYTHEEVWLVRYLNGELMCGLPNDPHIIKDLNYSDYKPYQIHTSHGFGPIESYFKIIKQEKL